MTESIFKHIKNLVATIPKGKVTTYGLVAQALSLGSARVVGWALRGNQNQQIPCHRVVQKSGTLSPGFSLGGWCHQRRLLHREGLKFSGRQIKNFETVLFVPKPNF